MGDVLGDAETLEETSPQRYSVSMMILSVIQKSIYPLHCSFEKNNT
jgi:hypothetical protein